MAQNPQQPNSNSANFPFLYQNQYYQNQLYYSYNSQQNSITPGKINQINTNTPPPPGLISYNSQPSPPGTTSLTQPSLQSQQSYNYQYYQSYQYPYYYPQPQQAQKPQSLYQNNIFTSQPQSQPQSQPPPLPFEQPPPPPGCPPKINSINPSTINNNNINITNNNKEQQQNKNNQYNQIKFNINSNTNQNSFKPAYITVNPEKPKNNLENNNVKTEMKIKTEEKEVYPQSLKEYIARMYRLCKKDKLDILDKELKKLIDDAKLRNALHIIKWENMDLPLSCQETNPKENQNLILSNSLLNNNNNNNNNNDNDNKKKRKRISDSSSSTSLCSSQLSNSIEMDESLLRLPEKERMEEIKRRQRRAKRFNDDFSAEMKKRQEKEALKRQAEITKQMYIEQNGNPDVVDWDQDTLVGTCQDLEKNYLRLTSAPDPATVRPLPVLRKTLELLKKKWMEEQNYNYICDQFKSLRQDLTVQRIKNDFAVEVYEIHARIALEKGDLGEYNQCQSQLKQLYKLGFNGNVMEFTAYRLLYYLHTLNPKDINALISELTPEQKKHEFIKHAMEVRSAVANGNYHKLFELYLNPPHNMACYLMDHFVERERIKALKVMTKAYLTLSIPFITDELAFDSEEECIELLKSVKCPIKKDKSKIYIISGKETHPIFYKKWQEITKRGIDIKGQI